MLKIWSIVLLVAIVCLAALVFAVHWSRHRLQVELHQHAVAGQPIVRALESFEDDVGRYPDTLAELAPKYLPTAPDAWGDQGKYDQSGWGYRLTTNGASTSYCLIYQTSRETGVWYEPPQWLAIRGGAREVILTNVLR